MAPLLWSDTDHLNSPLARTGPQERFTAVVPALKLDGSVGAAHFQRGQSAA